MKLKIIDKCVVLGIMIDSKLKFDDNINQISKTVSKSIGILYKLHLIIPKNILNNIYYCTLT